MAKGKNVLQKTQFFRGTFSGEIWGYIIMNRRYTINVREAEVYNPVMHKNTKNYCLSGWGGLKTNNFEILLVSCQSCNVVKNVVSNLHNQPRRIGYEEIHRDTYRRGT